MLRSTFFAALVITVASALMGCQRSADLSPAADVPAADYDQDDGSLSIAIGETVHVLVNGDQTGYDTEVFECDGTPTLVASDPSVVTIATAPYETVVWNSYAGPVAAFAVTGLTTGEVVLTGTCDGLGSTITVRVHA